MKKDKLIFPIIFTMLFISICMCMPVYSQITGKCIIFSEWSSIVAYGVLIGFYIALLGSSVKTKKYVLSVILLLAIVLFSVMTGMKIYNVASDIKAGPQAAELHNCEYEKPEGWMKNIGQIYTVIGKDNEGKQKAFIITKQQYDLLQNASDVYIMYYKNINRITDIVPVLG